MMRLLTWLAGRLPPTSAVATCSAEELAWVRSVAERLEGREDEAFVLTSKEAKNVIGD